MKTFLKYLGAILVLIGAVCLICYHYWLPENWLLVLAMVLEVIGIIGFVIANRFVK